MQAQVILQGLGHPRVLHLHCDAETGAVTGSSLHAAVRALLPGAQPACLRLARGSRGIAESDALWVARSGSPTVVRARVGSLPGGKGGFGAQLKASAKASKASSQQDASRDLQGRRLRHANREKLLQQWRDDAPNRELERVAETHLKQRMRSQQREAAEVAAARAKEEVEDAFEANASSIQDAVTAGLKRSQHHDSSDDSSDEAAPPAKAPRSDGRASKGKKKGIALPDVDSDLSSKDEGDEEDDAAEESG